MKQNDQPKAFLGALFAARDDRWVVARRTRLHRAGQSMPDAYRVTAGWFGRFRESASGVKAFTGLYMAGDIMGLDALGGAPLHDDVVALTDGTVLRLSLDELRAAVFAGGAPALAIAQALAADGYFLREALVAVGTEPSRERLCTFLLQTWRRLIASELIAPDVERFDLPLTQVQLGAVTGITGVHINRVLRALRESGPFEFKSGVVSITDPARLRQMAG